MRRCRCCRQTWPPECFRIIRGDQRRATCRACEAGCGNARRRHRVEVTRAWKARVRAEVAAVRHERAA